MRKRQDNLPKLPRSVFSQLLIVWLAFLLMVFISYRFVRNIVHDHLKKEAENILSYTESKIITDLREGETTLQTVSQSINNMILRGDTAETIHEYMIDITDYLSSGNVRVSAFNGVYGCFDIFDWLFLDGTFWIPPDDFNPRERPWYKAATESGIMATTVYTAILTGEPAISYSRRILDDNKNPLAVICVDVNLNEIYDYIINTRLAEGGYGMLITGDLEVIATPSKEHLGKHLSELPYKGIANVADNLQNGINIYEHEVIDDQSGINYILFTRQIENGWHIGILTPIGKYYQQVTNMRNFIAILGALLALGLSLILFRITRARQKADEASLEARAASKAKGDFLATMSHEIRTPLNAIIGLSEIEMQGTETSRENITQIHRSGTTLLGMINDILDISKIEAGRFELSPAVYDTASMINDTVSLNRVRIGSMPVNFVLEIDGSFPNKLYGDELRIKQILNNLLSNAIKYTKKGTVTLSVSCELTQTHPEALLRFRIQDTGIGIRAEDMGKLFTSYTQLNTGTKRTTEGTGLGLAIVKSLTEMMGGGISVESEYGKGSVFTAQILQAVEKMQPIGNETAENLKNFSFSDKKEKEKIDYVWLPGVKLLVVDDIHANLLVTKGLLAPYGIQTDAASSGKEAIELVKTHNYDIVLMDHMMPEMDGIETITAIRAWEEQKEKNGASQKRMPIVAMTANALRGMREFYLESGFDDYLSKPISPQTLHEILIKWLKNFSSQNTASDTPRPYPVPVNKAASLVPQLMASFVIEQSLDVLNHYRGTFDNGREIELSVYESDYYAKFTSYVKSLAGELPPALQEQPAMLALQAKLIEAGQKEDCDTICQTLPAFCDALKKHHEQIQSQNDKQETEQAILNGILPGLQTALLAGDTKTADAILGEMGKAELSNAGRELYIRLYDLLFEEKTETALELIANQKHRGNND